MCYDLDDMHGWQFDSACRRSVSQSVSTGSRAGIDAGAAAGAGKSRTSCSALRAGPVRLSASDRRVEGSCHAKPASNLRDQDQSAAGLCAQWGRGRGAAGRRVGDRSLASDDAGRCMMMRDADGGGGGHTGRSAMLSSTTQLVWTDVHARRARRRRAGVHLFGDDAEHARIGGRCSAVGGTHGVGACQVGGRGWQGWGGCWGGCWGCGRRRRGADAALRARLSSAPRLRRNRAQPDTPCTPSHSGGGKLSRAVRDPAPDCDGLAPQAGGVSAALGFATPLSQALPACVRPAATGS